MEDLWGLNGRVFFYQHNFQMAITLIKIVLPRYILVHVYQILRVSVLNTVNNIVLIIYALVNTHIVIFVDHLSLSYLGAYLGKGTYWQFFHKLDSRETSLLNAANHLKIFLIEFEICLYEHLYFLYIRNPLFPIVAFISMFWQLKVNMFYQKNSFPIV